MANRNKQIAEQILSAVGGKENIDSVTHCMTRLRFILKDQSIPEKNGIKNIAGVIGTNIAGDQYQVIIGDQVGSVYKEFRNSCGNRGYLLRCWSDSVPEKGSAVIKKFIIHCSMKREVL